LFIPSRPYISDEDTGKPLYWTQEQLSAVHLLNNNKWPNAEQLRKKLNIWLDAHRNRLRAYESLTDSEKSSLEKRGIEPPDEILHFD